MKTNEFISNVNHFTIKEVKSFKDFLLSPFLNTSKSLIVVYRIIIKDKDILLKLDTEELRAAIIRRTKYTEATVAKMLSELNDLYALFAKVQMFLKDKVYGEYLCCKYLLAEGYYKSLEKRLKTFEKILNNKDHLDEEIFLRLYEKDILEYDILSTKADNFSPQTKLKKQMEFTNDSSLNLMVYTISKVTINFANYVIQCNDSNECKNKDYQVNMERLFEFTNTSEYDSYNKFQKTTILIFQKAYKLFSNPLNDGYYKDYKDYYEEINHLYNLSFRRTHHSLLLNYCYMRQRMQDIKKFYQQEALDVLYEYIDNEYYKNNITDYLHPAIFRNYVINCMTYDKKEDLEKFVTNQHDKLNPSESEMMKTFGMAHYYFLNKEYAKSIENAKLIIRPKVLYRYDMINLMIKNYFEMGDFVSVEKYLPNYKKFIDTDSYLTKNDKERYRTLVTIMKEFIWRYHKSFKDENVFELEHLTEIIDSKTSFVMKNWLREKVTEIISEFYKMHPKKRKKKESTKIN
jgi:hypothetical protein